jgi:hypothetical protein
LTDFWEDRLIPAIFVCFMLLAVGKMALDPFGFFLEVPVENSGTANIHSLTIFLLSLSFLFFWWLLRDRPFISRVLLTIALVMAEYTLYDSLWGFFFLASLGEIQTPYFILSPNSLNFDLTILSFIFWWLVPSLILITLRAWERKYIPKIRFKRVLAVVALNFLLILWLWTTNFFQDYLLFTYIQQLELTTADSNLIAYLTSVKDPHNVIWAVGKILGMLSFWLVFVDFSRKSEVHQERMEKTGQKKYVPWHRRHKKKRKS